MILLKILLMIINTLLNEHNQLKVMYVDIIVCIMILKNVMTYLWKKLFLIYLIMITTVTQNLFTILLISYIIMNISHNIH